jgi:ribosomal protein S6--L-glutamate ligase
MKKIGVVGVPGGWSSERLADALAERTGFRLLLDPEGLCLDLAEGRAVWRDQDLTSLDGLIVKKVGPSYSPRLLDRLEMLRWLNRRGLPVFSAPDRILAVLNRLSCTVGLRLAGIPMPPTVVSEDPRQALAALNRLGPCVLKPLYTSKARGMVVVEPGPHAAEEIARFQAEGNQLIYMQQRIQLPGRDLGVVFLGGRYLATYARAGAGNGAWNTTTRSGGKYQPHQPSAEVLELAQKAQAPFGLDFTCVDVAETDRGLMVFEVSAFGGFRGLMEADGIDAAALYADYVLERLNR